MNKKVMSLVGVGIPTLCILFLALAIVLAETWPLLVTGSLYTGFVIYGIGKIAKW